MTGLLLSAALQMSARCGVNLHQELHEVLRERSDLKLISRAYEPKTIALTFDDGPHAGKTEKLLKVLKQIDVKATFFLVGKMVDKNPELVREELAEGHEVANHTYNHLNLDDLTEAQVAFEYRACSAAIKRATGFSPLFCRPPGGRFDAEVVKAATDEGMWTVLWTDDPGDFARPDTKVLVERVDRQMKDGGILLLHDGIPQTMHVLPMLVRELRARGYKFVTCSELLAQRSRSIVTYSHGSAAGIRPASPAFRRKPAK